MKRTEYHRAYYHKRRARLTAKERENAKRMSRFKARIKRLGWTPEQAMAPVTRPLSKGYLSSTEVAKLADCEPCTVGLAIRRGELRAARVKFTPKRVRYEIHIDDARYWATVLRAQ